MDNRTSNHEMLQALIGRALVDPVFSKDLLNGHRAECLAEYDLSIEEHRAASAVQASDLRSFAGQLDTWITTREERGPAMGSLMARSGLPLAAVA